MKSLLLCHICFLPLVLSLLFSTFGLHQYREDFFPIAVLFRKVDEWLSAFVEFGLVVLKNGV